jgi:CRISPR-associated protein Cmr2
LFETVETLRREFGERFNEQSMAFSAGIAIAHYKTPLGEVMNYARNMEKKAKERDGKNAFGIVVMKHSGEILETVLPWQSVKEQEIWNTSLLRDIHEKLKDGVSAAFIKNLNEELHIWDENPEGFRPQSEYEIRRLILRAKGQVSGEDAEYLAQKVQKLYAQVQTKGEEGTNIFLRALSIIDFLNRKIS